MMHKGEIVEDYAGAEKKRVRTLDLMETFDRVGKRELFDETVAEMLAAQYG
jgi:putative ABC transport system ATP-binding protein